jgi:hypothetical protein
VLRSAGPLVTNATASQHEENDMIDTYVQVLIMYTC